MHNTVVQLVWKVVDEHRTIKQFAVLKMKKKKKKKKKEFFFEDRLLYLETRADSENKSMS